jgi:hypothetical protein
MGMPESWDPPMADDDTATERRNVVRLIRVMACFIAFPSLTTVLAFLVFEGPSEHWMHIGGLSLAFVGAAAGFVMAPRMAERFVRAP